MFCFKVFGMLELYLPEKTVENMLSYNFFEPSWNTDQGVKSSCKSKDFKSHWWREAEIYNKLLWYYCVVVLWHKPVDKVTYSMMVSTRKMVSYAR